MKSNDKLNIIILLIVAILSLFTILLWISNQHNDRLDGITYTLNEWRLYEADDDQ